MSDNLSEALVILAVGMITVFVILALVVATGHFLIRIINKYSKDAEAVKTSRSIAIPANYHRSESAVIQKKQLAAIVAAVAAITDGKGKVERVERV